MYSWNESELADHILSMVLSHHMGEFDMVTGQRYNVTQDQMDATTAFSYLLMKFLPRLMLKDYK